MHGVSLQTGQLVEVRIDAKYVGRVGSTVILDGSGGVSRVHKNLLVQAAETLLWQEESAVVATGYVRTVGKRGGLLLSTAPTAGYTASISGKQVREVKVVEE